MYSSNSKFELKMIPKIFGGLGLNPHLGIKKDQKVKIIISKLSVYSGADLDHTIYGL